MGIMEVKLVSSRSSILWTKRQEQGQFDGIRIVRYLGSQIGSSQGDDVNIKTVECSECDGREVPHHRSVAHRVIVR